MGTRPREFRILGPLEVVDDGRTLALGGRKQRALLALLLLNPNETLSTDRLIDELWGEQPPAAAAKTVQVTVSRLRKALGDESADDTGGLVLTRDRGYELRVDPDRLDAQRFERLLVSGRTELAGGRAQAAAADLEKALSLWRGPALAELADQPFARHEIGRLEDLRLDALEELIDAKLALGRHAEVIGQLELLIGDHPYRERPRAQLMLALYRSDRQADALQAYQDARRSLVEELGIEPSERLRDMERAVLAQDQALAIPAPEAPPAPSAAPRATAFVGRSRELDTLTGGLERAVGGRGGVFLVAGEPGVGKSRLTEELIGRAGRYGARVLVGRCWEAGGAPAYWPWVQALRSYVRETDAEALRTQLGREAADLATILPELRDLLPDLPEAPASDSEGSRFRLLEGVAAFLRRVAGVGPIALVLDDLHAADASSLLLLRFVAGDVAGARILIVGCYRDTEVGPALGEALAELAREPAVQRLALTGLSDDDTTRLLELTMGEGPADDLAARIQAETRGNPLFATEIGRLLASDEGAGDADRPLPIPEGVSEAIRRRLQRQSAPCQAILAAASVLGREFDPDVVERVSGLDENEALGALDEAAEARLVGASPDASGRLAFSHILVRDALYHDLTAPRRLHLHRVIGDALEARYAANPEPHAAELAHHYLAGGTPVAEKAIEYARRAGARAASQLGYEEAARHYASALRVLEVDAAGDAETTCTLLVALGEALSRAGRVWEAKDALRRAADLAEVANRPDLLAQAVLAYGSRFAWARASTDRALVPLLERALAAVRDDDSPERVRLLARLAGASRDEWRRDRRVRLGEEAVEMAKRIGDPATLAFALEGHYVAVEGPETAEFGLEVGAQLIAIGEQIGDRERVFAGHDHRFHTHWQLGDRAGIEAELQTLENLADELRQPAQRWHVGTGHTMLALMEGRFEDADRLIAETLHQGEQAESWNAVVTQRIALFVLRREQGRLPEIEDEIRRSVAEYPALLRFRCAWAHLCGELGHEEETRAALEELIGLDLGIDHVDAEWVFGLTLVCDPCAYLSDHGMADTFYALLLPYERFYAQAPVEGVFGSAARGLGVLATALGRFDDAERHFGVAIELEHRMGARPWLAHTRHDLAGMLLARAADGDREQAHALLAETIEAYRALGMETWAARAAALEK